MARVTADEVGAIIDIIDDGDDGTDIEPFISTASSLVDEVCVPAGYDDNRLNLIELWLAAHFYAVKDPRFQSQGIGGASGSYQGQTGMQLESTTYGQQAMILDTKGGLALLNHATQSGKRGSVGITWLGNERS